MKKIHSLLIVVFIVSLTHAIPSLINYQGRLVDPNGEPLTGNKSMSVSIYDAVTNGSSLYTEDVGEVTLDGNGIYSFSFGTNETDLASALQTTGEHWLELTVNGSAQTPRERVLSVPFAQVAGKVQLPMKTYTNDVAYVLKVTEYYRDKSIRQIPFVHSTSDQGVDRDYIYRLNLPEGAILQEIILEASITDDPVGDGIDSWTEIALIKNNVKILESGKSNDVNNNLSNANISIQMPYIIEHGDYFITLLCRLAQDWNDDIYVNRLYYVYSVETKL